MNKVVNKLKGTISVLAVKAPGFGDRRKAILELRARHPRWGPRKLRAWGGGAVIVGLLMLQALR